MADRDGYRTVLSAEVPSTVVFMGMFLVLAPSNYGNFDWL